MTTYRLKSQTVDAIQWDGTPEAETVIRSLVGRGQFYALDPDDRASCGDPESTADLLASDHNAHELVSTGAWIILRSDGHISQLDPDRFAETYEPEVHPGCMVAPRMPHAADQRIVEHAIRNFRFSSFGFGVVDTGLSDYPDEQKWVGVLATMIVAALTNAQTVTASEEMP